MRMRTRRIEAERDGVAGGRGNHRRIAAATAVALAAAGTAAAVPSTALADTAPTTSTPGIAVTDTTVSLYGAPADLDITVTDPPTTDVYIGLGFSAKGRDQLRLTDDAGNVIPINPRGGLAYVGMADTDGNGIPGAPLTNGVVRLHLSVEGPVDIEFAVSAALFNGADGKALAHTKLRENGVVHVSEPRFSVIWQAPDGAERPDGSPAVAAGGAVTTALVETGDGDLVPGGARTRVTIPARAIAAAGYTAEQLAAHLHL
ncbi:MAG: hypothetical protein FWE15_01980, partial [Actinomycetia bacterium]|nr:hypothetical protein [Actinomycetes bacterium]